MIAYHVGEDGTHGPIDVIDLKFEDRFVGPILYGKKTTTLRRSRKADVGDRFSIAGQYYIINSIDKCEDLLSILSLWKEEGFQSAGDMLDWMEAHDYSPPLYLHRFERLIETSIICQHSQTSNSFPIVFFAYFKQNLLFEDFKKSHLRL